MELAPEEVERWRVLFEEHDVEHDGVLTGAALVGFVSGVVGQSLSATELPDVLERMVSTNEGRKGLLCRMLLPEWAKFLSSRPTTPLHP